MQLKQGEKGEERGKRGKRRKKERERKEEKVPERTLAAAFAMLCLYFCEYALSTFLICAKGLLKSKLLPRRKEGGEERRGWERERGRREEGGGKEGEGGGGREGGLLLFSEKLDKVVLLGWLLNFLKRRM